MNRCQLLLAACILAGAAELASGEEASAWSREVNVYNGDYFTVDITDASSREFSVYLPPLVLAMDVSPPDAGTTIPDICESGYEIDDVVDIYALPYPGFAFDHWEAEGGILGDPDFPCTTITLTDNASVTA